MTQQLGGTFIIGVTTTPDPVRTALFAGLDAAPACTLARIHARFVGFHGPRAELARRLELTDSGLRTHLDAMAEGGFVVRERFNVNGRWSYVIAVTDTPGILPDREALRNALRNGMSTWSRQVVDAPAMAPQAVPRTAATSRIPRPAATCEDAATSQVGTGRGNSHVNRFPVGPLAPGRRGGGLEEPVNRFDRFVPASSEVQAHEAKRQTGSRSVISSLAELEALAKMRGARPTDGGKFRQSREVLAASRPLDQNVVEDGLALLGAAQLPFWVAPEVWALLNRGWTPDRVLGVLDGVHGAKSAHSAARYRLAQALESQPPAPSYTDSAEPDDPSPGGAPAPENPTEADDTPPDLDALVERDTTVTPTWEEQAATWATETEAGAKGPELPQQAPWDRPRRFGWRAPETPAVPAWNARVREFESIRTESGGGVAVDSHMESKVAEIRAGMLAKKEERGGW